MDKDNMIQAIWAVEQEILDVFHDVCTAHNLQYSLGYGTLLGAVRHKGFIPWDDDIDIIMPREDYDKLLSIWRSVAPNNYLIQDYLSVPDYPNNFAKIVKDHTTFLQDEWARTRDFHKGLFVDIFPADRVAPGFISRKFQYIACAVNLLYSRNFTSGTGGIIGIIERTLLKLPHKTRKKLKYATENYIKKWHSRSDCRWFFPNTIQLCRKYYPATIFDNLVTMPFHNKHYSCVADSDTVLKLDYGNYMELPPEEDRVWKHHPILIDFERNYDEIEE